MFAKPPLLTIQQGTNGTFVSWLKDLGLNDLIDRYSLPKLMEWGWLIPQYRVVFPADYFLTWRNFPCCPRLESPDRANFDTEDLLWDSTWCIDDDKESLWFLHPFFRPDDVCGSILHQANYAKMQTPVPDGFIHPRIPSTITPYADYFFHWQAYALIDIVPIINTPDAEKRAQGIVHIAALIKNHSSKDILRWEGLAEPMTWLSHYRVFRDALYSNKDETLYPKGAKQLAAHLGFDADMLEQAIKEKLLVLAQNWLKENERSRNKWTLNAWPYLQKDIYLAVEWLCYLNGKFFTDYLEKWQYPSMGQREWAELHKVLPYEFFEDRQYFLRYVPFYKNHYTNMLPIDDKLKQLVDHLQSTNYSFSGFLNAFRQLHENLVYNPKQKGSMDFRELRPLDYYSLLAFRAESCFRDSLCENGSLPNIEEQGLAGYIEELAKHKGISSRVIDYFKGNAKSYTQLRDMPKDPINKIMSIKFKNWSKKDTHLVQAFLSCLLARNYFAHHTYLDGELIQSEASGFMLTGILITVLVLLDSSAL